MVIILPLCNARIRGTGQLGLPWGVVLHHSCPVLLSLPIGEGDGVACGVQLLSDLTIRIAPGWVNFYSLAH